MGLFKRRDTDERGQILVIVALGLVVMVAMVGIVIDGGYAWGDPVMRAPSAGKVGSSRSGVPNAITAPSRRRPASRRP